MILSGKVALITGAGTGLGKATAIAMASEGAIVVLSGRRMNKLEEVQLLIQAAGGTATVLKADVSIEAEVMNLVEQILSLHGTIDIVVNNAAVFEQGSITETSLDVWNYHITNNLTSAFLVTKAILPTMRAHNYGRIINITSGLAMNGAGGFAAYSASKAGLESLTRTVAEEESGYDILANLFSPGTVKSEMHATGKDPSTVAPELVQLAALPRNGGTGQLITAK